MGVSLVAAMPLLLIAVRAREWPTNSLSIEPLSIGNAAAIQQQRASSFVYTPPSAAAAQLQQRINSCIEDALCTSLTIKPGIYAFNSAPLNIVNATNLQLWADGDVQLLFSLGVGVTITGAQDVSVQGLAIDYAEHPYSQGEIYNISDSCFSSMTPPLDCFLSVIVHDGFPAPDPHDRADLCYHPNCETKIVVFDGLTTWMRRPQAINWFYNSSRLPAQSEDSDTVRRYQIVTKQMWAHNVQVGDVVAVAPRYRECTYQILHSRNVSTIDVRIHGSSNMAFYELGGTGGHRYKRVQVARPHPKRHLRYLASNFDGIHSQGTILGPTVTDSYFEHIGDDFFNVQNAIDIVLGIDAAGRVVIADDSFGSSFPVPYGLGVRFFSPDPTNRWGALPLSSAKVMSAKLLTGEDDAYWRPLTVTERLQNAFFEFYGWKDFLAPELSKSFQIYALELDSTDPARLNYTTLVQLNTSYGSSFSRNYFKDGLSRAGPLNSPHSVCRENVFNGTMYGGVIVSAEIGWLSGNIGIDDVVIVGNTFVDCCSYSRMLYPYGQCSNSSSSLMRPLYNPAHSTNVVFLNNTVDDRVVAENLLV